MSNPEPTSQDHSKSEKNWASPVKRLRIDSVPDRAVNLNVDGKQLTGPLHGFGQLWQKTYQVNLPGGRVKPNEIIRVWKEKFSQFWPKGSHFYSPVDGITAGDVALLNLAGPGGVTGPGGTPVISTGIMVIYADDESFSFMTPQGHMLSGIITFRSFVMNGETIAEAQAFVRASDPLYELGFRMGIGHKSEDEFWKTTLHNLALNFGIDTQAYATVVCLDPNVQWSEARNIWDNAAIRTILYTLSIPFRWMGRFFKK